MRDSDNELHHLVIQVDGRTICDVQVYSCNIKRDENVERYQVWGIMPEERRGTYISSHPVIKLHADCPGDTKFMEGVLW